MKILTAVPEKLLKEIKTNNVVYAKTDFENPYSKKAYQQLKHISGFENFFFGIVINDYTNIQELKTQCCYSNPNNNIILTLEIPQKELFLHDYYDFSDLIALYENLEKFDDNITPESISELLKNKPYDHNELTQAIYPKIKKQYIRYIEPAPLL